MTKLAYSRILTERFQRLHLIVNYSILGLSLVLYLLLGGNDEWIITLASIPGALIFLVSIEAFAYRKAIEGDSGEMLATLLSQLR